MNYHLNIYTHTRTHIYIYISWFLSWSMPFSASSCRTLTSHSPDFTDFKAQRLQQGTWSISSPGQAISGPLVISILSKMTEVMLILFSLWRLACCTLRAMDNRDWGDALAEVEHELWKAVRADRLFILTGEGIQNAEHIYIFAPIWSKTDTIQHCPELLQVKNLQLQAPPLVSGDSASVSVSQVYSLNIHF